ncbi:MAG TPA: hypothetical protein VN711_02585 [Candidatus Saccharimonadales bacterium]|nr:hypothetical protein [Candidatus Saccharimonadales bacterium]
MKNPKRRTGKLYKNKSKSESLDLLPTITNEILLSEEDRITYVYVYNLSKNKKRNIKQTHISYEIKVLNKWYTILRYDSAHGYLHRHTIITTNPNNDIVNTDGIKKRGDHHKWMTWAINDIKRNFFHYRSSFLKRNKDIDR